MKLNVTMKCPDAVDMAIQDATQNIEDEEARYEAKEKAEKVCRRFFEYGEYLTVEVDTETGTCTVVPN